MIYSNIQRFDILVLQYLFVKFNMNLKHGAQSDKFSHLLLGQQEAVQMIEQRAQFGKELGELKNTIYQLQNVPTASITGKNVSQKTCQ